MIEKIPECSRCGEEVPDEDMQPRDGDARYHELRRKMNWATTEEDQQYYRRELRRYNKPVLVRRMPMCSGCWVREKVIEDELYDSE